MSSPDRPVSVPRKDDERPAWDPISCADRDALVCRNGERYEGLKVAAGRTDLDGQYGEPCIFTEWYDESTGLSVLQDYRYPGRRSDANRLPDDARPCEHFAAHYPTLVGA